MVYVGDKKYACATCIKGHRSSSCQHTDRPLIEVKKKGRPVTQCEHCRDLRKTKQVHVKCLCASRPLDAQEYPRTKRKPAPPSPTFPNGLSDVPATTPVRERPLQKQRIAQSCDCDSSGQCQCAVPVAPPAETHAFTQPAGMLNSLVQVATASPSMLAGSGAQDARLLQRPQSGSPKAHGYSPYSAPVPQAKSCCGQTADDQGPPQAADASSSWASSNNVAPEYRSLMATLPDLSGYACCCGATCACPGCVEHRGPEAAATSLESCPVACSSCFDCSITIPYQSAPVDSWLKNALPPPSGARTHYTVDGSNVMTYPANAWMNADAMRNAGLVKGTSLSCCGGQCKCPANSCRCSDDCCGCCDGCACEEHQDLPHYTGYQGSLRCGYQVSGERGSCCATTSASTPSPPSFSAPSPYTPPLRSPVATVTSPSMQQRHFSGIMPPFSQAGMVSSTTVNSTSYMSPQMQHSFAAPDKALMRQLIPKTETSSPGHSTMLSPVPFQPAPGNFTLGMPDPQLVNQQLSQNPSALYSRNSPALYHFVRTPST